MEEKLLYLIKYLIAEKTNYSDIEIPTDNTERFRLCRSLVNIRPAVPCDYFIHTVGPVVNGMLNKEHCELLPILSV